MNNNMKFVGSLLLEIGKVHIHVCVYSVLQVPVVSQVICDIHTYLPVYIGTVLQYRVCTQRNSKMYDVCLMSCVPHTCPMYVCTCHVLSTVVLSTTVQYCSSTV